MTELVNIDLFAGIGGFHTAWRNNKVATVWASEWNKSSRETYTANYGLVPEGDITKIDVQNIPPHNILSAGFPCQAFSVSGKQLGFADTRGTLFFDVARIAEHHQPEMLLLENVKNFAQHDGGKTLATVLATLDEIGYSTFWKVLSAKNFGVPQDRQRIYVVAFRDDLGVESFEWPDTVPLRRGVKDILVPSGEVPERNYIVRDDLVVDEVKVAAGNALVSAADKPLRVGHVGKGGQGNRVYHYNGCAITLSSHGGGAGAKTGLYYTPEGRVRKLVPRETTRLMGFGDDFVPHPSVPQALQHSGNAVVVDVAQKIGQQMLKTVPQF